jgi:hypothetical protein
MRTCFCACVTCMSGGCCMDRWREPRPFIYPYLPMVPWPDYTPTTKTNITLSYVPLACGKCGSASVRTRWHQHTFNGAPNEGPGTGCSYPERNDWPSGEHLHRTCQDCGYVWATAVIGASK